MVNECFPNDVAPLLHQSSTGSSARLSLFMQKCSKIPPQDSPFPTHLMLTFCRPYDTMEEVIGIRGTPGHGSLKEWGVTYRELPLASGGLIDWTALRSAIKAGNNDNNAQVCQLMLGTYKACPILILKRQHVLYTLSCTLGVCADRASAIDQVVEQQTPI